MKAKPPNSQSQRDRFIEAARELGCDEDEAAFKENLARIARVKPKDEKPPAPAKRGDSQ